MLSNIRSIYRTNFRRIFGNKNQHLHWLLAVLFVSPLAFYDVTIEISERNTHASETLVKAPYIDENGWTVITPSTDTRKVYVSSSEGDDANDGLSESTPIKTVSRAQQVARGGYPDWILFKKGDTWDESIGYTGFGMRSNSQGNILLGRSAEEPFVITSYGTGARPRLISNANDFNQLGGRTYTADYFVVKGLELYAAQCDPSSAEYYVPDTRCSNSFSFQEAFNYILIEGNLIRFKQLNAQNDHFNQDNLQIRRNVLTDPYSINAHSQCIYTSRVKNLLIEENVFNHCGWIEDETINAKYSKSNATIFNRSMYLARGDGKTIVRGNIDANGSSGGVQMRQGGNTEGNLFLRSPISIVYGSSQNLDFNFGGIVKDNVVLDARDISGAPRGNGIHLVSASTLHAGRPGESLIENLEVRNNVIAHNRRGSFNVSGVIMSGKMTDVNVHHNIVYDWAQASDERSWGLDHRYTGTGAKNVNISDNIFQQPDRKGGLIKVSSKFPELRLSNNKYYSISSAYPSNSSSYDKWFSLNGGNVSIDDWESEIGDIASSGAVNFVDPDRTIDTYMTSIGIGGGYDEFMRRAKLQERGSWDTRFTAEAVNAYIRAGFMIDTDNDGVGDESPFHTEDTTPLDTDSDTIPDSRDNCPNISNTDQLDTDNDGKGNVCDTDDDGDGILDTDEKEGCTLDPDTMCGNTNTLVKAPYIDENGWTVITPSTDTRKVYVSSSEGDDANDGLSEATPVKTVLRAQQIARSGYPDWILFKKGDVWDSSVGYRGFRLSYISNDVVPLGRSIDEPYVITSYGTGARPKFITKEVDFLMNGGGGGIKADHFVIMGLDFHFAYCDPSSSYYEEGTSCASAFSILIAFNSILLENNVFRFKGFSVHSTEQQQNLKVRRNIFTEPYAVAGHAQCIYTSRVENMLIEENIFNHCGWIENEEINSKYHASKPTIYNRSMYLARGDGKTIVRGNIDANGASGGVQMRQGGYTEGNLFLRSPIAMTYGSNQNLPGEYGGVVKDNVVLDARNIGTASRAAGLMITSNQTMSSPSYPGTSFITDLKVYNNIITHNENGAGKYNVVGIGIEGDGKYTDLHIHHNVIHDWTRSDAASVTDNDYRAFSMQCGASASGSSNVVIENNIFQQPQKGYVVGFNNSPVTQFRNNKYWSASSNPSLGNYNAWFNAGGNKSIADWKTKFPDDAIQTTPVNFVDPDRTIDTYMTSIGIGGGYDEFMRRAKLQERGSWDTRFTAAAVNAYIRTGFMIDTDNDGVGDESPFYEGVVIPTDTDSDTIPDSRDNCPNISNPDQLDTDNDGEGNVCDTDDDGDGILDINENTGCELNPDTTCGNTTPLDTDSDTIPDSRDNCPNISNPDQLDTDNDGKGNVCDTDDDGDGILDVNEKMNCELNTNTRCGITIGGSPRGRGVFTVRTSNSTSPKNEINTTTQDSTSIKDSNVLEKNEQQDNIQTQDTTEKTSHKVGRGNGKIERRVHHISRGVIITLSSENSFIQNYLQNIEKQDMSEYGSRVELRNTSQGVAFVVLGKDEGETKKIQETFRKGKEEVVIGVKEDKVEVKDKEVGIELSSAPEKEDLSVFSKLDINRQTDTNIKQLPVTKLRPYRQKVLHMRDGVMIFISSKTSSGVSGVQSMSFPLDVRYSVDHKNIRSGVMLYIRPNVGEYTLEELYKLFPRGVK